MKTIELTQHQVSSLLIFLDHVQALLPQGEARRTQEWIEDLSRELDATHAKTLVRASQRRVSHPCQICGSTKADECGGCSTEERRVFVCENCKDEHICLAPHRGEHLRNP